MNVQNTLGPAVLNTEHGRSRGAVVHDTQDAPAPRRAVLGARVSKQLTECTYAPTAHVPMCQLPTKHNPVQPPGSGTPHPNAPCVSTERFPLPLINLAGTCIVLV